MTTKVLVKNVHTIHTSNEQTTTLKTIPENEKSYFISEPSELNPTWFENAQNIGICGATSTPMWLMKSIQENIKNFENLIASSK